MWSGNYWRGSQLIRGRISLRRQKMMQTPQKLHLHLRPKQRKRPSSTFVTRYAGSPFFIGGMLHLKRPFFHLCRSLIIGSDMTSSFLIRCVIKSWMPFIGHSRFSCFITTQIALTLERDELVRSLDVTTFELRWELSSQCLRGQSGHEAMECPSSLHESRRSVWWSTKM